MKILKRVGIVLLGLIGVLFIISLFLPSHVRVERSKLMNVPAKTAFGLVNDLKQWHLWSPWHKRDPKMAITWGAVTEGKGASYSWKSDHDMVGDGKMRIIEAEQYKHLKFAMSFMENDDESIANYTFEESGSGVKVTWSMEMDLSDPMSKYFGLLLEKFIGPDFEAGLRMMDSTATKLAANSAPAAADYQIVEASVPAKAVLTYRAECKLNEISATLGKAYGEIMMFAGKNKISPVGPPFAIYHEYSPKKNLVILEAGMPVSKVVKGDGKVVGKEIAAGKALKVTYFGEYSGSEAAHTAIYNFAKEKNIRISEVPTEVYMNDPGVVKDPAKYQTDIFYPVL